MSFPLRARRTRLVTVSNALAVTVNAAAGDYFPVRIVPPQSLGSGGEGSPRDVAARSRLVYPYLPPQTLSAGSRVSVYGGAEYELLQDPRPRRRGHPVVAYEAEVLEVSALYPLQAALQDQGGAAVSTIACSLFVTGESAAERGDYEAYSAESPIENEAALQVKNRQLLIGTRRFRIVSAVPNYETPRVLLELRRAVG